MLLMKRVLLQPQINQIPKSRIKADLAIGLGFCAFILLALSGFYLWKADIYKKQFNSLIEQQQSFSLYDRISLELEQQSQFLLSLAYQNNPKSKENFDQSRERMLHLMQKVKSAERFPGELRETSKLQALKLQQISRHLNETAEHVFNLMARGEIRKAKKTVDAFVRPLLENEIPMQIMFFLDEGMEHLEQTKERWRQKEKILAVISNAVVIVSLLAIFFISINLKKKYFGQSMKFQRLPKKDTDLSLTTLSMVFTEAPMKEDSSM